MANWMRLGWLVTSILFAFAQPRASVAAAEIDRAEEAVIQGMIADLDALEAELVDEDASLAIEGAVEGEPGSRELRHRRKVMRKFERQYRRYVKHLKKVIAEKSGEQIEQLLTAYSVSAGGVTRSLNGSLTQKIDQWIAESHPSTYPKTREGLKDLRELKAGLISVLEDPAFKAELMAEIDAQIEAAGSARAYLRQSRDQIRNRCVWRKTGGYTLMSLGYVGGGALIGAAFVSGMAANFGLGLLPFWVEVGLFSGTIGGGLGGAATLNAMDEYGYRLKRRCLLEERSGAEHQKGLSPEN